MGCEASVDAQQGSAKPVESHLDDSLPIQNQKASAPLIQKQQMGPIVVMEKQSKQSEESKILAQAKRLEKDTKYTEAIELYLKVKDATETKVEVLRSLGGCYRLKSMFDQSIKYSLQSFNLEKNQESCRSLGICYRNKKDYKSSIEWFLRGLQINSSSAQLHNALGITYKTMNDFQKAEEAYKKALQLNSKYELGFQKLAELYNERNRVEQAISIYQKVLEINPKKVSSLFQMAVIYKNKLNKMDEALKCLTKAIEIDPKYSPAYNTIGNIKLSLNQLAEAEINFKKSIQCDPDFRLPYNGLGNTFYTRQLFKQAKQCYIKSIQKDPQYSTPYSGLGDANWKLGQLDKAIQSYLKSIELNPKDDNPYNGIGNVYKTKGDMHQSIKWLKKTIEVNPKNKNPYNGLGNAYKQLNMYDEAMQYYLKAIEVDPNYSYPYNGIANIYHAKKQLDQAEKWYKKALQVDPNYSTVYNNLGNLYSNHRNNIPKAIEYYNKALSLNPKNQAAYNGLGIAYKSIGKTQQAIDAYKKAIECSSSYPLACVNLALCYIKIQNYPEAFKALKKAKDIIDNADRDVFGGCKGFITKELAKFDAEMTEWQYKSKMGYLTKEDIDRIQNLRMEFENKFKNLFSSSAENMEQIDPNQFRLEFMEVLDRIKEDGFTLSKVEQIADIDFKLFRQNPDDFSIMPFMFCKYFWEQKTVGKKSIKEIQGLLDIKIGRLNELFPPSVGSVGQSPAISLKREVPEKVVNLFKDVEYFKDYRYLVKQIEQLHQTSHLVLPKFKDTIYKVSSEFGGYHSKANLKLPEKENDRFKVYIRVMEKMFKEVKTRKEAIVDKIDQRLTKGSNGGMQAVMGHLVEVWTEEISAILQARSKDHVATVCNITDLVRGKSMFKSASDVETAANRLIDELDKLGYEITEIDNRLKKETRDLVFKVLIDGIVCEYQMALETDSVQYNYSHCYYEIRRSPLGCIFGSYLFLSKYEILSFAKQAKEICTFYKNKRDNQATKRTQAAQFLIEALQKNI